MLLSQYIMRIGYRVKKDTKWKPVDVNAIPFKLYYCAQSQNAKYG